MSRLQAIENALMVINETVFQELCDSFLALRNSNYSAFCRTGSQGGKQKTIPGTPDSFLLLPNGKYIFIEHSTNITKGVSKLKDDIKKCLDASKTSIPIDQISEIIICINFKLNTYEVQELNDLLAKTHIILTINTLDSLAIELHLHHRDIAHQYLNLPLDTGQIVSTENFIEEYNRVSKGISTPLNNTFLHRDRELIELKQLIDKNDFIILNGPPGIGKTKLALEGIKSFLSENLSFTAYCISYKHYTLLYDLHQYLNSEKDYILFVDDANRIDSFNQITGFYKSIRKGKLKIIITVRDYAYQSIGILCQEFSPKRLGLVKFSDEQIIDIISASPFYTNQYYHGDIVRIADGNPRLAIMTALLAKAEQHIYALRDLSELFENYFSTFIKDEGEFAKAINIKCLGLIAFFYTIPYKNREITTALLNNFGIEYSIFIDVIDKLDKLELVEIQFEHAKIPEQNLSTYFFYKAFIKDNLLSFDILLDKYFDNNSDRFRDCVIPTNNTFGQERVMNKLQPDLKQYWTAIKFDEEKAFKFLTTFWYYIQTEALEFVYNIIEALPANDFTNYNVTYENNKFLSSKSKIIELLANFFYYNIDTLTSAIELAFEYIRKKPEHLPELIHEITEKLVFDSTDENISIRFYRQAVLFKTLIDGLNKGDVLYLKAFFELSKTFLSYKFHHTKGGRNHSIRWYHYEIPYVPEILELRKNIWTTVSKYFNKYPEESFSVLQSYASVSPDVIKEIMEYDIPFVLEIIEKYLSPSSFEHCKYVHEQISWCKRNSVFHLKFLYLANKYTNSTYEIFLKIDWDRLRDKEAFEFNDYREYEKLKIAEIRASFTFNNLEEVKEFYKTFVYLKQKAKNEWNYNTTLDYVIDENCFNNFELGCQLFIEIIENENSINYFPRVALKNHLKTVENANQIWSILQRQDFIHKSVWELSFYDHLDDCLLSSDYTQALIDTISNIREPNTIIHFDSLQRFLKIQPDLFQNILRKIVERNEDDEGIHLQVSYDFFDKCFYQLGNDIELIKKAYIQQYKIHDHFEHDGKGFLNILRKDTRFLIDYVNDLYSRSQIRRANNNKHLGFIWQIENIEPILIEAFDLVIECEPYHGIITHFCNSFFIKIQDIHKARAKTFLVEYCKVNYNVPKKVNVVVGIVRHSMKEYFEEILLLFLSLNQDKNVFSKILWRGNGGSYVGDVIVGDIEAAEWRNILSIVEKSPIGYKLTPIKMYLGQRIENSLRYGDIERQRRFLERD